MYCFIIIIIIIIIILVIRIQVWGSFGLQSLKKKDERKTKKYSWMQILLNLFFEEEKSIIVPSGKKEKKYS